MSHNRKNMISQEEEEEEELWGKEETDGEALLLFNPHEGHEWGEKRKADGGGEERIFIIFLCT
jgi:hypothetical protein